MFSLFFLQQLKNLYLESKSRKLLKIIKNKCIYKVIFSNSPKKKHILRLRSLSYTEN